MPTAITEDPDRWLAERLDWLRATLRPSKEGRCRPYVLTADGTVHTRRDQRWADRHWASVTQDYNVATRTRYWRVMQTRRDKPETSTTVVPVHHTLTAAERDARRRARQARGHRQQRARAEDEAVRTLRDGPDYWHSIEFQATLESLPVARARKLLVRVLGHIQQGRCGACEQPEQNLVLDHDHSTGLVRGALCGRCNSAEGGGIGWSPALEARLQAYRDNPPAAEFTWPFPEKRFDHPYGL